MGLIITKNKTKYMIVSRRDHSQNTITIKDPSFERVRNFKHLGVDINSQADCHKGIYRTGVTNKKNIASCIVECKMLKNQNTK